MVEVEVAPSQLAGPEFGEPARALGPKLRLLWLLRPDYNYGLQHGGHLRRFNLARLLISLGHEVYFLVPTNPADSAAKRRSYLQQLQADAIISGFFEFTYEHPKLTGKLGRMLVYPGWRDWLLGPSRVQTGARIHDIVRQVRANVLMITDRDFLFLQPKLAATVSTIVEWCDSYVLYHMRELQVAWKRRELGRTPGLLKRLAEATIDEFYYGRRCDLNIVVSPVDKRYVDFVSRRPEKVGILMNGVDSGPQNSAAENAVRIQNRLIFTGNMDFPPNYQSAIWFIDEVLPVLHQRRPDLKFVVAGANPVPQLLARKDRAGVEITGYVDDMRRAIRESVLYVAPLVCGGGFKNKVVEAISAGTFVVASSMAVEFLSAKAQQQLLVADKPEAIANAILKYLDDPAQYEARLASLQQLFATEFTWEHRAAELIGMAQSVLTGRSNA